MRINLHNEFIKRLTTSLILVTLLIGIYFFGYIGIYLMTLILSYFCFAEIQNLKNILGNGSPESYDQYKHIVGTIRGIEWARQELITIIKNINQEEE